MTALHVEVSGSGPDLVLLHGWAMHSGIWGSWVQQLSKYFRVHAIDLPGHGYSQPLVNNSLESWSDAVLAVAPKSAAWVGWSLGGLMAQSAVCKQPERIKSLVLLASTPCFVANKDWPDAVSVEVFEQFEQQLSGDVEKTILRFLSLQVRGSDSTARLLKMLRAAMRERPLPNKETLLAGLSLLQHSDLRSSLSDYVPALLLGERDTLVPASLAAWLENSPSKIIKGAGHAPFLLHPGQCTDFILGQCA